MFQVKSGVTFKFGFQFIDNFFNSISMSQIFQRTDFPLKLFLSEIEISSQACIYLFTESGICSSL